MGFKEGTDTQTSQPIDLIGLGADAVKKQKNSMDKFMSYGENAKRFIELISFHWLILNRVQNIYASSHLNKIKPIFDNQ